jgi:pimeloyl-ACP methyl ester carboxylesterase
VEKLVLAVTLARPNDTVKERCATWINSAKEKDYQSIMKDSALYSYSDEYLRKNKMMLNVISKVGAPKSFDRFITFSKACTTHNAYEKLEKITCPTLVIGGKQDKIVTYKASEEIASKIPNAKLKTYEKFGHAAYEEAKDFNTAVYEFCCGK